MANIFKQQKEVNNHAKRNNFDLSFQNHLTMKMGTLYPVFCKEVVPGDSFRIESAFGLKFLPLAFPVQSKMRANMHFYYVRNKNLWNRWEDWIEGLKTSENGVVHPFIRQPKSFFETGKLADYLNIPTDYFDAGVDGYIFGTPDSFVSLSPNELGDFYIDWNNDNVGSQTSLRYHLLNFLAGTSILGGDIRPYIDFQSSSNSAPVTIDGVTLNYQLVGFLSSCNCSNLSFEDIGNDKYRVYFRVYGYRIPETCVAVRPVVGSIENNNYDFINHDGSSLVYYPTFNQIVDGANEYYFDIPTSELDSFKTGTGLLACYSVDDVFADKLSFSIASSYVSRMSFLSHHAISTEVDSPFADITKGIRVSALPFRAYESICRCFYKNSVLQPLIIDGEVEYNRYNTTLEGGEDTTPYHLEQRNYELDFLTSALPSPQQGNAPLVGMSALGNITIESEDGLTTARAVIDETTGEVTGLNVTSPIASREHALTLQQIASAGMSINDFRNTNALQRWLETNIRKGYRYLDFIAGHFGKSPKYSELDMPEFIGGFSRDVQVSQIVSSADTLGTGGQGLGDFQGMANCFGGSNHSISHYCDDYGFIVGILCIVPTPSYSQLLPKHYLRYSPLDYYFPEFSQLGLQPITYEEVCPILAYNQQDVDGSSIRDTFGYQRPNYHLVSSVDEVHGLFRTDQMRSFLIQRVFGSRPVLGTDFISIDSNETNQIFVDTDKDADQIIGQVVFKVSAKRPVPRVVIPNLGH